MRYTNLLGRILRAAEKLVIDGINISFPETTSIQIHMWINWLHEDTDYSQRELDNIEMVLVKYLEV